MIVGAMSAGLAMVACSIAVPDIEGRVRAMIGNRGAYNISTMEGVTAVVAGDSVSGVVRADGSFGLWGRDRSGQLRFKKVLGKPVKKIALSGDRVAILNGDGTVEGWGWGYYYPATPPAGLTGVVDIEVYDLATLALREDGTLVGWGSSQGGVPTPPPDLGPVRQVAMASYHVVALKTDGSVRCWGSNSNGECDVPSDLGSVVAVETGNAASFALMADGTVRHWGLPADAPPAGLTDVQKLSTLERHVLALRTDGTVVAFGGYNTEGELNVPEGLRDVVDVAAGVAHSVALRSDGSIVYWGSWSNWKMPASVGLLVQVDAGMTGVMCGRRADGSVVAWGHSYFGEADVPEDLPPAIHVETGFRATMALLEDGTIRCWGDPNGNCAIPPGLDDVVAFSASYHTAAVRSDGSVVCWGRNTDGQCNVPAGVDSVVAVSAGEVHTLAVSSMASGGRVTAWGKNDYGQCSVPGDLEGVVSVSAGRKHSVALKADGKVRCWGTNLYGSFNAELHPEPIKQIGVLDYATVLLEADGDIVFYPPLTIAADIGKVSMLSTTPLASDFSVAVILACPADFDRDGIVSGADLAVMLAQWGQVSYALASDINADGIVDQADLGLLLAAWGPCQG
jgi:alpha-tubulin suppressor-like RCC1 family protein